MLRNIMLMLMLMFCTIVLLHSHHYTHTDIYICIYRLARDRGRHTAATVMIGSSIW